MSVRAATTDDVEAIAQVQTASWEGAYRGLMPDSVIDGMTAERRAENLSRYMASPPPRTKLLVAEAVDDVVGMAWLGPSRDDDVDGDLVAHLFALYVAPEHWGAGHGKALMVRVLEEMHAFQFQQATLWVLDTNERGIGFYARGGWSPDGAEKLDETFGAPLREVRYRIRLSG